MLWLLFEQFDKAENPEALKLEAVNRGDTVCISALTGEGIKEFYEAIEDKFKVNTKHKLKLLVIFCNN